MGIECFMATFVRYMPETQTHWRAEDPNHPWSGHWQRDIKIPLTYEEAKALGGPFWQYVPDPCVCTYCGATFSKDNVKALSIYQPLLVGEPVYRNESTGVEFQGMVVGAIIDHFSWGYDEEKAGTALKDTDLLPVPLADRVDKDGKPHATRVYSSNYRNACLKAGIWLPQWIVAIPSNPPIFHMTFMYANNGALDGDGYMSGWETSGVAPKLTCTPSIFFQGDKGWHGFLTGGILA